MSQPYQLPTDRRPPRFRLAEPTPAVLEFPDSRHTPGELQIISRTGGLLSLSKPVDQGSVVRLMFRTHRGPVSGTAEMLRPVSWNYQPFRFVRLEADNQHRMQEAFQSRFYRNLEEEEWIEELRAKIVNWNPPPRRDYFRAVLTAVTLAILCLSSVIYLFRAHLR